MISRPVPGPVEREKEGKRGDRSVNVEVAAREFTQTGRPNTLRNSSRPTAAISILTSKIITDILVFLIIHTEDITLKSNTTNMFESLSLNH